MAPKRPVSTTFIAKDKLKAKTKAKLKTKAAAKKKAKSKAKTPIRRKAKPKAKAKAKTTKKAAETELTMPAPERNKFWTMRSSHGRKPKFKTPEALWSACMEYFEWAQANPLKEHKQYHHQGNLTNGVVTKMRAMTVTGLCIFLDIDTSTWRLWASNQEESKKGFLAVTARVREIIDTQKMEGAAADLLNANIIARDLGLKDANTHEHTGEGGGPVEITRTVVYPKSRKKGK